MLNRRVAHTGVVPLYIPEEAEEEDESYIPDHMPLKTVLYKIWYLVITIGIQYFFMEGYSLINIIFIGRSDDLILLSAVGISNIWITSFQLNVFIGIANAAAVVMSFAFGAKKYRLFEKQYRQTLAIFFIVFCLEIIIVVFAEEIFLAIGQEHDIAHSCKQYLLCMTPAIFLQALFKLRSIYLAAQERSTPPVYIQIFSTGLHILWCWLFFIKFKFGILGIAFATGVTQIINVLCIELYILKANLKKVSLRWNLRLLHRFAGFLKIVIPMGMIRIIEEICNLALTLITGAINKEDQLAAHVSCTATFMIYGFFIEGFSEAMLVLVGKSIGEEKITKAKKISLIGLINGVLSIVVISLLNLLLKNLWTRVFVDVEEANYWAIRILPIALMDYCVLMIFHTFSGLLKCLGQEKRVLVIEVAILYGFQVPLAYYFGIQLNWMVEGVWLVNLLFDGLLGLIYFSWAIWMKWEGNIDEIKRIMNSETRGASLAVQLKGFNPDQRVSDNVKTLVQKDSLLKVDRFVITLDPPIPEAESQNESDLQEREKSRMDESRDQVNSLIKKQIKAIDEDEKNMQIIKRKKTEFEMRRKKSRNIELQHLENNENIENMEKNGKQNNSSSTMFRRNS